MRLKEYPRYMKCYHNTTFNQEHEHLEYMEKFKQKGKEYQEFMEMLKKVLEEKGYKPNPQKNYKKNFL